MKQIFYVAFIPSTDAAGAASSHLFVNESVVVCTIRVYFKRQKFKKKKKKKGEKFD